MTQDVSIYFCIMLVILEIITFEISYAQKILQTMIWQEIYLDVSKEINGWRRLPKVPDTHSSLHHLYVLFHLILFITMSQGNDPTLHLVAKGNLSWTSIVFFGHGAKNWIVQKKWGILVYPKRKSTNTEIQKPCVWFLGVFTNTFRYYFRQEIIIIIP